MTGRMYRVEIDGLVAVIAVFRLYPGRDWP
jgi:hypothetical protein